MALFSLARSPQEKAFTDKYKTAFEGKDTTTLESFLYTQGADPAILGFYKMMQSGEAEGGFRAGRYYAGGRKKSGDANGFADGR